MSRFLIIILALLPSLTFASPDCPYKLYFSFPIKFTMCADKVDIRGEVIVFYRPDTDTYEIVRKRHVLKVEKQDYETES